MTQVKLLFLSNFSTTDKWINAISTLQKIKSIYVASVPTPASFLVPVFGWADCTPCILVWPGFLLRLAGSFAWRRAGWAQCTVCTQCTQCQVLRTPCILVWADFPLALAGSYAWRCNSCNGPISIWYCDMMAGPYHRASYCKEVIHTQKDQYPIFGPARGHHTTTQSHEKCP